MSIEEKAAIFAQELADAAREIARHYFRHPLSVDYKADLSPVTMADREIESMMRARIAISWPDHGILGEEHGREHLEREYVWVLDPIDGTKSFISGNPLFGTMICLLHHGRPVLSLVDVPMLDERWLGRGRLGASLNGGHCRARSGRRLADAIIYTTSPDAFDAQHRPIFDQVSSRAALRRFGGDCYSYGLLASGHVDVVFGAALEPYDFLPLTGLVESAGGVVSDWAGKHPGTGDSCVRIVASATPELHAEILALLRD